jgi:cellulose synthase/poly-beta-1,6-N-acetylglucosamine synthase-like glycosyltransferase
MQSTNNLGKHTKIALIIFTVIYLILCVLAATENWKTLHTLVIHFFIAFAIILVLRQALLIVMAMIHKLKQKTVVSTGLQPSISVIMPAFNEANVIEDSLSSLLQLNYENYEIIIVDDGSIDATSEIIRDFLDTYSGKTAVRLISQSNAGKANALNTGLIHANSEFVLCVDADAKLNPDCLLHGIHHFKNHNIGAVAGNVVVGNERNWLTRFQQLEYLTSQNFMRRGLALFGIVTIVPGPIGLFRKSAILEAHGYREDADLFAEDADLSIRLLQLGWQITSEENMRAITEAPADIFALLRQRYRWKRGIFQALKDNFFALITAPNIRQPLIAVILIFEGFLFEVIGFGITLFMLTNIIYTFSLKLLVLWLLLLLVLDVIALLIAAPFRTLFKWIPILLIQKITYTYALQCWGVLSLMDEWRSTKMSWDKLDRTGLSNNTIKIKGASS